MGEVYKMNIAGCERALPICPIDEHMDIAGFVMFSDVEITKRPPRPCWRVSRSRHHRHRGEQGHPPGLRDGPHRLPQLRGGPQGREGLLEDPIHVEVKSITTDHVQKLYLSKADVENLKGKRILIVDDVISTGESLAAMEELLHEIGGKVVGKACVLAEGDAKDRTDIIYLEPLPLFFK